MFILFFVLKHKFQTILDKKQVVTQLYSIDKFVVILPVAGLRAQKKITMGKKYYTATDCPITTALDVIGGKWKPIILWLLTERPYRFGELHKSMPGIALKVLSRQLKELEEDRMINRRVFAEVPPRVEYSLTAKGKTLCPVLQTLADWSRAQLAVGEGKVLAVQQ
jgi:DNA-binding HxlR family transcriptional regulator